MRRIVSRTTLAATLGISLHLGAPSLVHAQGVPVVDTQNIAQNIQQLRQMIEDEILQNEQLVQLREQIETQMDRVLADLGFDEDTLSEMASSGNASANRIATQATTGALVSAAAQNSYEDAGQSLERVDRLVGLIDDMDELKESVDLNTRVTAELAIALVAMWQLEAVQTVGDGTGGVIDAATIAEEQRFMDFTLPDLGAD